MKKLLTAIMMITVLPAMCISMYFWYCTLTAINADRLVWFLFYIYVPTAMIGGLIAKSLESIKE